MVKGISLIWAMDKNRLIGKDNQMPWHLPAELAYFRKVTTGHPVLMGRRTYESIGKPLPNRTNVILTRNEEYKPEGCIVIHSIEEALERFGGQLLFIIGGAQIYRQFLPYAEKLYVTLIDHEFAGDEYFPELDWENWRQISVEPGITDERNPYSYSFQVFEAIG